MLVACTFADTRVGACAAGHQRGMCGERTPSDPSWIHPFQTLQFYKRITADPLLTYSERAINPPPHTPTAANHRLATFCCPWLQD